MKKYIVTGILFSCVLLLGLAPLPDHRQPIGVDHTLSFFRAHALEFAESIETLAVSVNKISAADTTTIINARQQLKQSRLQYKQIEFFFNYFFPSLIMVYNAPAVIEVEEPFMETREPTGLQVIGALLYEPRVAEKKDELVQQVALLREAAFDINALLHNLPVSDAQILESIRLDLINVMLLGMTGTDAQEMKTGITEARQSFHTFETVLEPYLKKGATGADSVTFYLQKAIALTTAVSDFDSFDRLTFLVKAGLPLQTHLGRLINALALELNSTAYLNYETENIFSPAAININNRLTTDTAIAALGKKLFSDKILSGTLTRSCATCHQPGKYYSDGLPQSRTLDEKGTVKRNAPGLMYAGLQHSQFWDGRVKTLEEQVIEVVENPVEMGAQWSTVVQRLAASAEYRAAFATAFSRPATPINKEQVSTAIAAFINTLTSFDSPFDQYIRGNYKAMTPEQVKGFNLFMGKAFCGTCHTAPLFNGLTLPLFDLTAMEVVGTTADTVFTRPRLDADSGKYTSYPLPYYLRSFKTPGLRNVAATAPYMHNGAFPTLESVVEFYNKGGGEGMGLPVAHQTLSPTPLQLDAGEIKSIVSFLQSLTDQRIP